MLRPHLSHISSMLCLKVMVKSADGVLKVCHFGLPVPDVRTMFQHTAYQTSVGVHSGLCELPDLWCDWSWSLCGM